MVKPLSHSGKQLSKKKYVYWILSVHIRSTVSVLCQVMLSSVFKIVCRDLPPGLGPEERLTGGLGGLFLRPSIGGAAQSEGFSQGEGSWSPLADGEMMVLC